MGRCSTVFVGFLFPVLTNILISLGIMKILKINLLKLLQMKSGKRKTGEEENNRARRRSHTRRLLVVVVRQELAGFLPSTSFLLT